MTGWNMPPGVNARDIPGAWDEGPCDCCGRDASDCICPECPVCSEQGNRHCYDTHGLQYNKEQRIGQAKMRVEILKDQLSDEFGYIEWLMSKPDDWRDK